MGKLLTLLIGFAVLFGVGYWAVYGVPPWKERTVDEKHQTLQKVRDEAKRIEADAARRASDLARPQSE
jgi:F0F1-type ATP synthase membrane subunit b/b'